MFEYRPYSKAQQLGQKEKDTPKIHNRKRYPDKKKKKRNPLKPEVVKGRVIPTKKKRGAITKKEYNEALRQHGETCYFCGSPHIEMHHVIPKGHSKTRNGRGTWRNLRPLCTEHHRGEDGVHGKNGAKRMKELQELHERLHGENYYKDRYDLFKEGLIPTPTIEAYEKFMKG
ncbi:putative HNH endonuclease [Bacillus phage vB_BhaS-171]|uniref:HNH endonuclease n=1 Tax=Bacillus phage vB_BhaS-171 TaxID=1775140 RepID=UPI000744D5A2|nr:HNH endonuclease [Bacillus phage vB_BhaS-171]ALY08113.1 putative HNH endonuclease [Bacillus phage vB_BhaS-171]